jgi:hypothetical protein
LTVNSLTVICGPHAREQLGYLIAVEFRLMPVDAGRPGRPSSMISFNLRSARARFSV